MFLYYNMLKFYADIWHEAPKREYNTTWKMLSKKMPACQNFVVEKYILVYSKYYAPIIC